MASKVTEREPKYTELFGYFLKSAMIELFAELWDLSIFSCES